MSLWTSLGAPSPRCPFWGMTLLGKTWWGREGRSQAGTAVLEVPGGGARPAQGLPTSSLYLCLLQPRLAIKNLGVEVQQISHMASQSLSFLACKMEILILPTTWDVIRIKEVIACKILGIVFLQFLLL